MDYNIYIHDKTTQTKPTQARRTGGTNTTPKKSSSSSSSSASGFSLKNIKSGFKNMPAMGKIGIALYVAKKAYDLTIKVIDTVEPFVTRETGDYRFNVAYNNFKQTLHNITNPISTVMSAQSYYHQNKIYNKKQEQERLLLGDSYLNSRTRKV